MKTIIYFFSASGNSLKIAKELAHHVENVDIVQIHQEQLENQIGTDADTIGFVFPTIYCGIPELVEQCIKKLEVKNPQPYIFAIATHGDEDGGGFVFKQISTLLKEKSLLLSSSFSIQMPHSAPEKDHVTTSEEKEQLYKQASERIPRIVESIVNKECTPHHSKKIKQFLEKMNYTSFRKNSFDTKFTVSDDCISCKRCSQICPAKNIEMVNGKPNWKLDNCQGCLACLNWCPSTAIQYTKSTKSVERYHHPNIKLKEIIYKKKITRNEV